MMKKLSPYIIATFAFAATAFAFSSGATWAGILAAIAGIVAIVGTFGKDKN